MNNFLQERKKPEQFCIQIVAGNRIGSQHFATWKEAKELFAELEPEKNGKTFTWGTYNGFCEEHKKHQMRFEDWETYEIMSA